MKKLIEKIKQFDKKIVEFERKHTFISRMIKVFLFSFQSFLIGSIIALFVDVITPNTFTLGQIIGCIFVVYSFVGYPSYIFWYDEVLDHYLQRIEQLEEKTDLLETQQDCIEKWYLNDDL